MPSDSNTDRNVADGYASAPAKGNVDDQDMECSTAVAKDDANGKPVPSKSGGSAGKGGCKCKGKNRVQQTERHLKVKSRGRRGRGKAKGRGKTGDTNPDADDATPKGIMKTLAGSICLQFSDGPNAKYGLPDMYRMLVAMCCGSKASATAEGQYEESNDPGKVRLPSRSMAFEEVG